MARFAASLLPDQTELLGHVLPEGVAAVQQEGQGQ